MSSQLLKLSTIGIALVSTQVQGVGFGEITLHSRVGEALRAEVPILANSGETIESSCFSLAPLRGSDLPVVSSARTTLLRDGANYRLLITGNTPIAEPLFIIGLRANCGIDLQRDYVLMPSEPVMTATAQPPAVAASSEPPPRRDRKYREWRVNDGDTLDSIAEALAPDDLRQQRRVLAALKRANPDLLPGQPLAAGTGVRVPNQRYTAPAEHEAGPQARPSQRTEAPPPAPPPRAARLPVPASGNNDRIVLGAPPDETAPKPNQPVPRGMAEMEERMLKLETTLHQLNQEVDKLNKVLELTAETMVAQQKLQMAQAMQPRPNNEGGLAMAQPAPPAAEHNSRGNWLELLFSALVGGSIAAGTAHLLGRRRERPTFAQQLAKTESAASLAAKEDHPPPRREAQPGALSIAMEPSVAPAPLPAVDLPPDRNFSTTGPAAAMAVDFNETASALELAEIMLAYGRIQGAAETLAQHIEHNSPSNVQPWLMLLDLYRRGNLRQEFDDLSQRISQKFNIHVASWNDSTTPVSGLKSLEEYAHISWRLVSQWGKQEAMDYLHDLIHDKRSGQRYGFPLEIVEEIALLMRVLEDGYGLRRPA